MNNNYGIITKEQTESYLKKAKINAVETAREIVGIYENGGTQEDAADYFVNKYYNEKVEKFYPKDVLELNTRIMVNLLYKELFAA